ncbi:carbon storage regulator CsrA [Halothermothrix orenii]|uniref:Translational regulator CsrA n=1 Tax=Halothermothrix orenii (strain H 168 / OCM 544 / DSM 9562) TaxID=373903 RepID=CSRA_HALOH|nr:carbon storage regulator CsrA [Halothermothrix orenii]B8CYT9.1 RecName: Full=Translational regulator CsrA [Halothermothrix orenii H 168]ACL70458.1 carbon storage regulator, CsrA [Halothermothrix orenii H 168]
MLILTRKKDEAIIIDDKIKVKVVEIDGNKIKLGIEAPDDVTIHREEVLKEILKENKQALKQKRVLNRDYTSRIKEFIAKKG